jgi:hypothetical protein
LSVRSTPDPAELRADVIVEQVADRDEGVLGLPLGSRLFLLTAAFGRGRVSRVSGRGKGPSGDPVVEDLLERCRRSRRLLGDRAVSRSASSLSRSSSASARSDRPTFLRDPSGKRTHAIHRCMDSFHLIVGRALATVDLPGPT